MGKTSSECRRAFVVSLLLVLITAAAYLRIADIGFITLDDGDYVAQNTHVQVGLTWKGVKWAFTTMDASNWHPLTWLSHMLDCQLYGLNPLGHHATNLLFHIANVLLLFLVLSRMTGSLWRSAFVAALFGVHPLHVESVAWIAERKDVLSTFFWLLTTLAYVGYVRQPNKKRYLPMVLFFALGLMSKPMLVTLPLILLLLDYWPLGRWKMANGKWGMANGKWLMGNKKSVHQPSTIVHYRPLRHLILEKVPLLAMSVVSCVMTVIAQQGGRAINTLSYLPIAARINNAVAAYAAYILKMLWPAQLAIYYAHPLNTLPVWKIAMSAALLICISALVFVYGRRQRCLVTGWLWYLITLIPVIGLVQVGAQAMADRYTYVPLIGLFVIIAWCVPDRSTFVSRRFASYVLSVLAVVIIAALATRTWVQTGYWKDDVVLFKQALRIGGESAPMHLTLGTRLAERGDTDEAIIHYRRALEIIPNGLVTHNNLGIAFGYKGNLDEAICEFNKAIDIDPKCTQARCNLALALYSKNQLEESAKEFRRVIDIDPEYAEPHIGLAMVLKKMGKIEESKREDRIAGGLGTGIARMNFNRGIVLEQQGKLEEAIKEYRKALRINPNFIEAYTNLGVALKNQGRIDEAIKEYNKAISISPKAARVHKNLAIALYIKKNYAEAWKEVHLARKYGAEPHPGFIKSLSQQMPDPGK